MAKNPIRQASAPSRGKSLSLRGWEVADPGYTLSGGPTNWSTQRAVEEGLRASHWVYLAIRRISQAASSVPWLAVQDSGEEGEDLPDHELTKLLAKPNEYTSGQDFIERIVGHLNLGGNAIIVKSRDQRGRVRELWPVMPDRVTPNLDDDGYLVGYDMTNRRGQKLPTMKPSEVVHLQFIDPGFEWWGLSPLQSVARLVDTDVDAVKWNRVALQNRAVPDGVLSTDQQLQDDQYDRMQAQMRSKTARESLILEAGLSWQQMSLSPAEMDFLASRKWTAEEILMTFGVPPAAVGIVQSATQSDVGEMRKQLWMDTILPLLADIKSTFNLSLAPEFGNGLTLRADTSEVPALQTPMKELLEQAKMLFDMGVPLAEINRRLALKLSDDDMPNTGYLPANLMPVDGLIEDAEIVEPPERAPVSLEAVRNGNGSPLG